MRAGLLIEPQRIEIAEVETPLPLKGELLVKVSTALTCGTDVKAFLRGHPMIPMPGFFGHEFSGIVADAGAGVTKFKAGDEIMAVHSAPCLGCRYCNKGIFNLCETIMQRKVLGAFAEYIVLPEHIVRQNVFLKPPHLLSEEAAFLEPLACVVHSVSGLRITRDSSVLIIGAGPIGLLHLLLVKAHGATVIIADLEPNRLSLAKTLGADAAVPPADLPSTIKEKTGGLGADIACECTGRVEVWEDSVNHIRRGGTVILFGGCKDGTKATYDTYRLHYDEVTLKGVFHYTPSDVKSAYQLLKERMNVSPLISGSYPLIDITTPFEKLSRGEGIKYAIIP